jgi:hypothetical protein
MEDGQPTLSVTHEAVKQCESARIQNNVLAAKASGRTDEGEVSSRRTAV